MDILPPTKLLVIIRYQWKHQDSHLVRHPGPNLPRESRPPQALWKPTGWLCERSKAAAAVQAETRRRREGGQWPPEVCCFGARNFCLNFREIKVGISCSNDVMYMVVFEHIIIITTIIYIYIRTLDYTHQYMIQPTLQPAVLLWWPSDLWSQDCDQRIIWCFLNFPSVGSWHHCNMPRWLRKSLARRFSNRQGLCGTFSPALVILEHHRRYPSC